MSENKSKKKLGQFYTTRYTYILQNLEIPDEIDTVVEPFAGKGDLLNFVKGKNTECYDIDPKKEGVVKRDTLTNPPDYNNKFVLTNPPYLARNKSNDKTIFDKYTQNDLYKCFIVELVTNICLGGIFIIPLNFWCSIRKSDSDLRKKFLNVYVIKVINIFEERVFEDTAYAVCSFQFDLKKDNITYPNTKCFIYPSKTNIKFVLNSKNNYTIGGEIYKLKQNTNIKVQRLTKNNIEKTCRTNILVKCIDDSSCNKIRLSIVDDSKVYIDKTSKLSARSYATLVIEPKITKEQEQLLVNNFNTFIKSKRKEYNSLFLTNYRESNTIARKRISFKLVFEIVNYLLSDIEN